MTKVPRPLLRWRALALGGLLALAACAPPLAHPATTRPVSAAPFPALATSDVPVDPGFRFGRLANGMRFVVRANATPLRTAIVRMEIAAGSLDEAESERGFAHFTEHMAFNGSTNIPEGEMVHLLERDGLAFGADTNASTSFERTVYSLDLPRTDAALLDTALKLMRETASELTFDPAAVARERGVVLSEMRDGNGYQRRNFEDQIAFTSPGARYVRRLPIGTEAALVGATGETLKAFWRRFYVPSRTTLVVIGDFDPVLVETAIAARFASWQPAPSSEQPGAGPLARSATPRTDIFIDPALSERVTASRSGRWLNERDTVAGRRENLLRQIGYAIVNRRFTRLSRQVDPAFRDAGLGTANVFKAGRTTQLIVDTIDGKWRRGITAAGAIYRAALTGGFTVAEVAEQVADVRVAAQNAAASADTRNNAMLLGAIYALLHDDRVPATPQSSLARLEKFIPSITPARVLAALKREALALERPLLRFQGRTPPQGGAAALRLAWESGLSAAPTRMAAPASASGQFAYTDFGPPGSVVEDRREPLLGIREVRFANGVRLNLKHTALEAGRVRVRLNVDGGDMLAGRGNPLATELVPSLTAGGLGKHSQDDLQTLLAGHTVGTGLVSGADSFIAGATTTPQDLALQLQLLAAFLTDPGYRPEGEAQYRLGINNYFAQLSATPQAALSGAIGAILSDDDPRFALQPQADYRKLTFADLRSAIGDRLAHGAIELALVGDIDEEAAIAVVARTFGALAPREAQFLPYTAQRQRAFAARGGLHVLRHSGPADQAVIRLTWPTRDDSDVRADLTLTLLQRVLQSALTDTLREALGAAYSPRASSETSRAWTGYGTMAVTAEVAPQKLAAARASIAATIKGLREGAIAADALVRARQPLGEAIDARFKSNRGWADLAERAQSRPGDIADAQRARAVLDSLTVADVVEAARRYLVDDRLVEILVLPNGAEAPVR